MATLLKYYKASLIFTLVCFALAAWYGWESTGTIAGTASLLHLPDLCIGASLSSTRLP